MPAYNDPAPSDAWPGGMRLWYIAVQDRQTGRQLGRYEVYDSDAETSARLACLECETDPERADVICWRA